MAHKDIRGNIPHILCAMHMPNSLTQASLTQVRTTQQQLQFCTLFAGCCLFFFRSFYCDIIISYL